jgi:hypothetical protein
MLDAAVIAAPKNTHDGPKPRTNELFSLMRIERLLIKKPRKTFGRESRSLLGTRSRYAFS